MAESGPTFTRTRLIGATFGSFRVAREIARGGMASVYLGHRLGVGKLVQPVAIKLIHSSLTADRDFVDMFLDEARITACIQHPNVCRVLDFGHSDGAFYMVLEFLLGETWLDVLHAQRLASGSAAVPYVLAAQLVAEACEGVHAAHVARDERGMPLAIVHRDLSPQNLHLGYDGSVRVLDFGIARAADRIHHTQQGVVKGRFAYMAPEQMRGEAVDYRADIWSLGVVLRESISGARLFHGMSDAELVRAVVSASLPPWPAHVPRALREIADRALRRDPADRYASARDLAVELYRYLNVADAQGDSQALGEFMQRRFAPRIAEKQRLLREAAEESLSSAAGAAFAYDAEECEEPTRVSTEPVRARTAFSSAPPKPANTADAAASGARELGPAPVARVRTRSLP